MATTTTSNEPATATPCRCDGCGEPAKKLYQRDLCKPCLAKSLRFAVGLIDYYRVNHKEYGRT